MAVLQVQQRKYHHTKGLQLLFFSLCCLQSKSVVSLWRAVLRKMLIGHFKILQQDFVAQAFFHQAINAWLYSGIAHWPVTLSCVSSSSHISIFKTDLAQTAELFPAFRVLLHESTASQVLLSSPSFPRILSSFLGILSIFPMTFSSFMWTPFNFLGIFSNLLVSFPSSQGSFPASQSRHHSPPESVSYLAKLQSPSLGDLLFSSLSPLSTANHKNHVGSVFLFFCHYLYT